MQDGIIESMRIVIIGGKGFIGKAVVESASAEHQIFVLSRPEVDVVEPETYRKKLKDIRPDVVINLTAIIGTLLSSIPVREMFATNTMGNLHLAMAAHDAGAKAYIFTSSTVVHGENKKGEHHGRFSLFAPKHPYSASKAAAEYALEQFTKEQKDMTIVTLRPPMVIGEGSRIVLPPVEFISDLLDGKSIQIFGEGLHEREFVSVNDIAQGIWRAVEWSLTAEKRYHPFFLSGNRISMRDLAEKAVEKIGGNIVYVPSTKQTFSLTTNPTETEAILGWKVKDTIDDILGDVIRFVKNEKNNL